jgi:ATP-dependent Clp protease ATP-binding subunit ClpB
MFIRLILVSRWARGGLDKVTLEKLWITPRFHHATRQTHHQVPGSPGDAQSLALGNDNAYIEPPHLLAGHAAPGRRPRALLQRAGVNVPGLLAAAEAAVKKLPQVQGQEQVQGGPELGTLLQATEKEAIKRGDQFIASELFLLAVADSKGELGKLARANGLTPQEPGGRHRRRARWPERGQCRGRGPARALKKYCIDLTERARLGKLDPVIGRDDEIRRAIQVLQRRTKNNPGADR